jgi:hypothetical protein
MIPPQGWQNLSPNRHRTYRESIPAEIRQIYPAATQRQVNDEFLTYWMPDKRLVAIGWKDNRGRWFYAIMPKMAFDMNVNCSLSMVPETNKYRILPLRADDNPDLHRRIHASYRRRNIRLETYLFEEKHKWYVEFETRKGQTHKYGPYKSYEAANIDVPVLLERVIYDISVGE